MGASSARRRGGEPTRIKLEQKSKNPTATRRRDGRFWTEEWTLKQSESPPLALSIGGKVICKGGGYGGNGRIRLDYGTLNGKAYPGGSASVSTPAAVMGAF